MSITVRYFASLRERLGLDEEQLETEGLQTVADLRRRIAGLRELPERTLVAVNQEYADPDHPLKDGDEVAFFPPVTGG
ncbi:MAG: molybdopterin converting factor subunit 1 [Chromatiales bacterium]|jgi:molybdopterin synthase sulfur carrier subunit|nr:molybdopterin converting factor subunit 1 [Chromatiales bacterium]MDX9767719.1 molybdopterin converting factor subunit 1 [Ectothiorhodospiraceae bacterium]